MAEYTIGEILPAKQNRHTQNPGPNAGQAAMDDWLAAQAQDKAYTQNKVLVEEYDNAKKDSPDYAAKLGANNSWAVLVQEAEAGGLNFDQQRLGPAVESLSSKKH